MGNRKKSVTVKKLLLIAVLLPCLVMLADDDDKSMVFWRNTGQTKAVRIAGIDSITFEATDLLDDSLFLFYRDTITELQEIHDTTYVDIHDTTYIDVHDTTYIDVHDTTYIDVHDTTVITATEPRAYMIERPEVADYLYDFTYPDDDYSFSLVDDYVFETDYRKDLPLGVPLSWHQEATNLEIAGIDDSIHWKFQLPEGSKRFTAYNLIPNHRYNWILKNGNDTVKQSRFLTLGSIRMINTSTIYNVRDIGGKPTNDGRRTAYGKIYRGATLNSINDDDRRLLLDTLGINVELDVGIGTDGEEWSGTSPMLGEGVEYYGYIGKWINCIPMSSSQFTTYFKAVVYKVHELLKQNKTIYLHCGGGADRTGALAYLLEILAGCSENDIAKDYELTSFSAFGKRVRTNGNKIDGMTYEYATSVSKLKNMGNGNLQDGMIYYLRYILHIDIDTINELKDLLKE